MKKIYEKMTKKMMFAMICALLVLLVVLNGAGIVFNIKYISIFEAVSESNTYEIRSRLLMEAMNEVGVCDPVSAANVWASGLQKRSAALQYSVMSAPLKKEYAKQLNTTFPNWVTGVSSPWVDSYQIIDSKKSDMDTWVFTLRFSTKTSDGTAGDYGAVLTVARSGFFWRIIMLNTDKELDVYTGFMPDK